MQPANLSEYLPFIEGYAHLQQWDKAGSLSAKVNADSQLFPELCATWKRVAKDMALMDEASIKIGSIRTQLGCLS